LADPTIYIIQNGALGYPFNRSWEFCATADPARADPNWVDALVLPEE
jgi:hypothetical protein